MIKNNSEKTIFDKFTLFKKSLQKPVENKMAWQSSVVLCDTVELFIKGNHAIESGSAQEKYSNLLLAVIVIFRSSTNQYKGAEIISGCDDFNKMMMSIVDIDISGLDKSIISKVRKFVADQNFYTGINLIYSLSEVISDIRYNKTKNLKIMPYKNEIDLLI